VRGETLWKTLKKYPAIDTTSLYFDRDINKGSTYEYNLIAYDHTGNNSSEESVIRLTAADDGVRPGVEKVEARVDRQQRRVHLEWKCDQPEILKFYVYRQLAGDPLRLFQTLEGNRKSYSDAALQINTTYSYRIKVVYKNGGESPLSEMITVNY
jgi:fibronectin type 3 domain-containing protein